jgi:hypothetical protein
VKSPLWICCGVCVVMVLAIAFILKDIQSLELFKSSYIVGPRMTIGSYLESIKVEEREERNVSYLLSR